MQANSFEAMLTTATIKAINGVAKKVSDTESLAEKKVAKLLVKWNDMDTEQKEHVAGIAIATITTAVTALVAMRRAAKSPLKAAAKSIGKRVKKR